MIENVNNNQKKKKFNLNVTLSDIGISLMDKNVSRNFIYYSRKTLILYSKIMKVK